MGIPGYDGLVLTLDPVAEAPDRTELDLNTGIFNVLSVDWGQAAITAAESQQGQFGNSVADFSLPNRTVTITLDIGGDGVSFSKDDAEAAQRDLSMKVGLFQREGGILLRQRSGGDPSYADVVNATLTPVDQWMETLGTETGIQLVLECLPDFYGAETILSTVSSTGGVVSSVLQELGNVCVNGGFEHDTNGSNAAGWTAQGTSSTAKASTAQALTGTKSLKVIEGTSGGPWGAQTALASAVSPGDSYTVGLWLLGNAGGETLSLQLKDSAETATLAVTLTTSWQFFTLSHTFADFGTSLVLAITKATGGGQTFFVDDVIVQSGLSVDDYLDGDTTGWAWSGTTGNSSTVRNAVIAGDYPARTRVIVTDTSGNDQAGVWWGLRSEFYDAADTAALVLEAEALTPINEAATHTHTGMSGGETVLDDIPLAGEWVSILVTDLLDGTRLTHRGSYRVIARAYSATAAPQLRLRWGTGAAATQVTNAAVALPGAAAAYELDLGIIRIDAPSVGDLAWRGLIQALAAVVEDPIEIDRLTFIPVAEGAAVLNTTPGTAVGVDSVSSIAEDDGVSSGSGPAWTINTAANTVVINDEASQVLKFAGFGFAIPSGAIIQGIQLTVTKLGDAQVFDSTVKLLKAGTATGDNKANAVQWPFTQSQVVYGSATDLWGASWAASDVNNASFGFEISAQTAATSDREAVVVGTASPAVIEVFYTIGDAFASTANRVLYADKAIEVRTEGSANTADGSVYNEIVGVGDLPRVPASGVEQRPCELLVVTSEGNLVPNSAGAVQPSPVFDGFTVQVKIRPCYLTRI